jgi:RNA polymerase sigma factor (sigma-70 family)
LDRPTRSNAKAESDIAEVVRTYSSALRRYFQRRVFQSADIDDLVQEVFLRLARRNDLSDVSYIEGYLFEIAANILRDRTRQSITRMVNAHQELDPGHSDPKAFSPERILIGRGAVQRLVTALQELPERARVVFILRQFEELRTADVAKRLDISVSTVEKDLAHAIAHLLTRMKNHL